MSSRGYCGSMGWASNDPPIIIELTKMWDEHRIFLGYNYYMELNELPDYLIKLHNIILELREHLIINNDLPHDRTI